MQIFELAVITAFAVFILLPFTMLIFLILIKYLIVIYLDIKEDLEN